MSLPTVSNKARVMLYLEATRLLKQRRARVERVKFLVQNPDAVQDSDYDDFAEIDGRTLKPLFLKHPHIYEQFEQWHESPERVLNSLHEFVRRAYRHTKLAGNFVSNWHIVASCNEYERIYRGENDRLMINQPPSTAKSVVANVFFPAWVWAQSPEWGFANFSYTDTIPKRDGEKLKGLVHSAWYRRNFGHKFRITTESSDWLKNNRGGWRFGAGVGGGGLGMHPHAIVIDDPQKATWSKEQNRNVAKWYANTVATRGMLLRCAVILIMQRLSATDLCGVLLGEQGCGLDELPSELAEEAIEKAWKHLCFPMRFDPKHRYRCPEDIRTTNGELLWPAMIDDAKVRSVMREMSLQGEPNVAAQFGQDPLSQNKNLFEELESALIHEHDLPEKIRHGRAIRSWDRAATPEDKNPDADRTAGVLSVDYNGVEYVLHTIVLRKGPADRDRAIATIAESDARNWDNYRVCVEETTGADGKQAYQALHSDLARRGIVCMSSPAIKSKEIRATPAAGAIKYGLMRILRGRDWTQVLVNELKNFPYGAHDDIVDALAHGHNAHKRWRDGKV
ncbi:MAG: hypothetical protein E6Q97_08985 [Desulfurellales bacterium]|nr:MAG: hypothetical protein E6Q97_08985 [Desulfurellales bacterium]